MAQLVEHWLPKPRVAGSSPVYRSLGGCVAHYDTPSFFSQTCFFAFNFHYFCSAQDGLLLGIKNQKTAFLLFSALTLHYLLIR